MMHLVLGLLGTTEQTRSPRSDETSLLTLGSVSRDGRCLTDMLVVTTTVRVIDGVHGNTTSLGPRVALNGELVLGARRLEEGLVGSATTSDNANHATDGALDDLLGTRWKLDAGLALIWVVADNSNVVTGCAAERASVSHLLLDIAHNGTLWDGAEREDVANGEGCVLAGIDELSSVHALVGDEGLGVELVSVRVTENDLGEWCAATGIVDNLLDYTANVAMALCIVVGSELRWGLVETGVGGEDRATALSLVADDTTHLAHLSRVLLKDSELGNCSWAG